MFLSILYLSMIIVGIDKCLPFSSPNNTIHKQTSVMYTQMSTVIFKLYKLFHLVKNIIITLLNKID